MRIADLGEFKLISRFSERFLKNLPGSVVGIGDDCAVIPFNDTESLLITTDMLIEDVHFLKRAISPLDLGHKALAVNLSDIAAMGGNPKYAVLSIALPPEIEIEWLDSFFEGFRSLSKEFGVDLIGGDTTRSLGAIAINVAVVGQITTQEAKLRSSARVGDIICVTGNLGDSGAGLKAILENAKLSSEVRYLIKQHHRPTAHIRQGQWLAGRSEVHAMMDVSDGIDSDIRRIMERSSCGATIQLEKLPISKQLLEISSQHGWNPIELAATAGEDYCLLSTVDRPLFKEVASEYQKTFEAPLYPIGEITDKLGSLEYYLEGSSCSISAKGFDHFSSPSRKGI